MKPRRRGGRRDRALAPGGDRSDDEGLDRPLSSPRRRAAIASRRRLRPLALPARLALVVSSLAAGVAGAHPQYSPTESNRYLKVSLAGGGSLRLAFTLMVGEAPALAVRRAADKNGDGQVDEAELAGYAAQVAAAVASGLELTVEGARRDVAWEAPLVGLADHRVGPLPLSIDVVGRLPVRGPGPHLIGVADHTSQHGLAEQAGESELRLEEGPGTRLLAAWHGQEDGARSTRFVWNGPDLAGDRTIAFRYVDDRAPRPRRRPPIALVGALVGAAIAGFLTWRRRRR